MKLAGSRTLLYVLRLYTGPEETRMFEFGYGHEVISKPQFETLTRVLPVNRR